MTIRHYAQEMGLRLVYDVTLDGFRCTVADMRLADSCGKPTASADGQTLEEAQAALAKFISRRILQDTARPTALYWVPNLTG